MKVSNPANITRSPEPKCAGTNLSPLAMTIEAGMPSEVRDISPFVDQLMRLIEESGCFVGGDQLPLMVCQKGAPCLGRRFPATDHIFGHCGFR